MRKKKKKKGRGPGKGAGFERTVAKLVVKAFAKHGIVQRDCWRSVLSGGHVMSSGDLVMSEKLLNLFPYAVECKFYRDIHFWHMLLPVNQQSKKWKERKWLQQAVEGAEKRKGLMPLLVIKANHCPVLVGVPGSGYRWRFELFSSFLKKSARTKGVVDAA